MWNELLFAERKLFVFHRNSEQIHATLPMTSRSFLLELSSNIEVSATDTDTLVFVWNEFDLEYLERLRKV